MIWTEETARPARIKAWPNAWKLAVATVCFGAFMGQLDASIVTLTYHPIESRFDVGAAAVQWVSLAYLLSLIGLLAPVGRRSDHRGRKLSYLHGFIVFSVGSTICGLAPDLGVLIAARVLQGAGAALLQANSVALVCTSAPKAKLRVALGVQAAAQAAGLALGPTVGGIIVAAVGWRWVFAINVPVGVIAIAAGVFFLPRTANRSAEEPTDIKGSLLLAAAVGALLLALSAASGLRLGGWEVAGLIVIGGVTGWALFRNRVTSPDPVFSRAVLSAPGVRDGLAAAMFGYLVLFGPLVLVPAVLEGRDLSALQAGLVLTALPAGFALSATVGGGALPRRWGDRERAMTGVAIAVAGLAVAIAAPLTAPSIAVGLAIVGLGLGVFTPANNASVMRAVPPDLSASVGGVLNMTRGIGTALGISTVTLCSHLGGPRLSQAALLIAGLACAAVLGSNMPAYARRRSRRHQGVPGARHIRRPQL